MNKILAIILSIFVIVFLVALMFLNSDLYNANKKHLMIEPGWGDENSTIETSRDEPETFNQNDNTIEDESVDESEIDIENLDSIENEINETVILEEDFSDL